MIKKTLIFILLNSFTFNICFLQDPLVREFKNSRLTFKSNESLTLEINDENVKFFMIADQGGMATPPFYTNILTYTSKLMAKLALEHNTHFQFAMGDNFYSGVQNVDDTRFTDTFENVFNDTSLKNTPWFLSLGNHDYGDMIKANDYAQIEYTFKSKRWILPNYLYELDILLNSELLIKSIIIDTQKICDEGTENERKEYLDKVIRKIEENSNTNAYYYLVLGHYPFWSIGELGPNECMINKLRPTLHKFKVDGYFSGHEHAMQHFRDDYLDHKVEYLVSGTSCYVTDTPFNKDKVNLSITKYFWESKQNQSDDCVECSGAIVLAKADKNQMILKFIDTEEIELYSFTIDSRKQELNKGSNNNGNLFVLYLIVMLFLVNLLIL